MAANELTPEEIEKHRKHKREYMRRWNAARTPEQRAARNLKIREYAKANRKAISAKHNEWRKNNPELNRLARARHRAKDKRFGERPAGRISIMVTDAKVRAKRRGLEFEQEILGKYRKNPPTHCECCHLPLDYALRRHGGLPFRSPSLDRFDNSLGYTLENTVIICWRCNHLKSDGTLKEMEQVVVYMRSRLV